MQYIDTTFTIAGLVSKRDRKKSGEKKMFSKVRYVYIDHSSEKSSMQVHLPDITAATYDAITANDATGNVGRIRLALAALTLCNEVSVNIQAKKIPTVPPSPPTDENAQREQALQIEYVDNVTGKTYFYNLPGIDRTLVAQTGTDVVDYVNNVLVAALVTALEADARSELGNNITVTGARMIGRNS